MIKLILMGCLEFLLLFSGAASGADYTGRVQAKQIISRQISAPQGAASIQVSTSIVVSDGVDSATITAREIKISTLTLLQNASSSEPAPGSAGQLYFNSAMNRLRLSTGTNSASWVDVATGASDSASPGGNYVSKTGDTMTGQLTLSGSTLTVGGSAFSAGGSTLVVAAGNVGIGTSGPGFMLDVRGNASLFSGAKLRMKELYSGTLSPGGSTTLTLDDGMGLLFVSAWYNSCSHYNCNASAYIYSFFTRTSSDGGGTQISQISGFTSAADSYTIKVQATATSTSQAVQITNNGTKGTAFAEVYELNFY